MTTNGKQLLHFVFGGELKDLSGTEFRDLSKLDIVGIFPDYASAAQAWKAKAQATVDNPICAISWHICIVCSTRRRTKLERGGYLSIPR